MLTMKRNATLHVTENINLKTTKSGELLINIAFLQNQLKLCRK